MSKADTFIAWERWAATVRSTDDVERYGVREAVRHACGCPCPKGETPMTADEVRAVLEAEEEQI